jgi:L-asparaginase
MVVMGKRILILHTGGTLGMKPRDPDQVLTPGEIGSTILEFVPELTKFAEIDTRVLFNIDSSDITPQHWKTIAEEIAGAVESYDGIVIPHGTDAMAYTGAALSYQLRNLPCPVILTGSQLPLADARSDAPGNLVGAVDLACHEIQEVAIYFHNLLMRGNRVTKTSTFAYGAFKSPNFLPLAEIGTSIQSYSPILQNDGPFRIEGDFDPRVAVLRLVPGQSPDTLFRIGEANPRAVLLVAFGSGNIPSESGGVAEAIQELTRKGILVAIGSQSQNGRVDLNRYVGGRKAKDAGAIGIGDMTLEAATVKLMYLFGTTDSANDVRKALLEPIAGELSPPHARSSPFRA